MGLSAIQWTAVSLAANTRTEQTHRKSLRLLAAHAKARFTVFAKSVQATLE